MLQDATACTSLTCTICTVLFDRRPIAHQSLYALLSKHVLQLLYIGAILPITKFRTRNNWAKEKNDAGKSSGEKIEE